MSDQTFFVLGSILLCLAILILIRVARKKKSLGLPAGVIIYADAGAWKKVEKPFYDAELGLTGKPDYVVKRHGHLIPVEIKSTWAPEKPYDSHIMQLASYCLLLERNYQERPPFGLIKYKNRTFAIRYTDELRQAGVQDGDVVRIGETELVWGFENAFEE